MPRLPRVFALIVAVAIAVVGLISAANRPATAQDASPPAGEAPEPVPYVDADERELALLDVSEVVDPFDDAPAGAEAEAGERRVLVAVAVENTGDDPLPLNPATILLRDTAGFLYGVDPDLQGELESASDPDADPIGPALEEGDVAPGDTVDGTLGFVVDEDADLSEVLFVPETGRLLVIADLGDDGGLGVGEGTARDDDEDEADATRTPRRRATATPADAEPTSPAADDDDDVDVDPTPIPAPAATEVPPAPAPTEAPPADVDSDGDGLTDDEEAEIGTDPTAIDSDGDGLFDGDEISRGTNPFLPDTDEDGVLDGDEVLTAGTDATLADTDGDGLGDADEAIAGTDPFVVDTDGDGLTDGEEVVRGSDPLAGGAEPTADADAEGTAATEPDGTEEPAVTETAGGDGGGVGADTDDDGLTDAEEATLGTNPNVADTEADGVPDGDEVNQYGTNPLVADSDGDGISDLNEVIAAPTSTPTP